MELSENPPEATPNPIGTPGDSGLDLVGFLLSYFTREDLQDLLAPGGSRSASRGQAEEPPGSSELREWVRDALSRMRARGTLDIWFFSHLERMAPAARDEVKRLARQEGLQFPPLLEPAVAKASLDAFRDQHTRPLYAERWLAGHGGEDGRKVVFERFEVARSEARSADSKGAGPVCLYLDGEAGSGRTRFVLEYARYFRHRYDAILILDAGEIRAQRGAMPPVSAEVTRPRIRAQLALAAANLGFVDPSGDLVSSEFEASAIAALVARFHGTGARCLLIVDNVLVAQHVDPELPSVGMFDVIVVGAPSTRDEPSRVLGLEPLSRSGAVTLLLRGMGGTGSWTARSEDLASQIASRLCHMPLALTLASGMLRRHRLARLLSELDDRTGSPEDGKAGATTAGKPQVEPADSEQTVTLSPVLSCLQVASALGLASGEGEERISWLVLRCMSWVAPDEPIGQDVLVRVVEHMASKAVGRSTFRPAWVGVGLDHLHAAGLIWMIEGNPCIHPLIQSALRKLEASAEGRTGGGRAGERFTGPDDFLEIAGRLSGVARERLTDRAWRPDSDDELSEPAFQHIVNVAWRLSFPDVAPTLRDEHLELCWRVVRMLGRSGQMEQADGLATTLAARPDLGAETRWLDAPSWRLQLARLYLEAASVLAYRMSDETGANRARRDTLAALSLRLLPSEDSVEDPASRAQLSLSRAELHLLLGYCMMPVNRRRGADMGEPRSDVVELAEARDETLRGLSALRGVSGPAWELKRARLQTQLGSVGASLIKLFGAESPEFVDGLQEARTAYDAAIGTFAALEASSDGRPVDRARALSDRALMLYEQALRVRRAKAEKQGFCDELLASAAADLDLADRIFSEHVVDWDRARRVTRERQIAIHTARSAWLDAELDVDRLLSLTRRQGDADAVARAFYLGGTFYLRWACSVPWTDPQATMSRLDRGRAYLQDCRDHLGANSSTSRPGLRPSRFLRVADVDLRIIGYLAPLNGVLPGEKLMGELMGKIRAELAALRAEEAWFETLVGVREEMLDALLRHAGHPTPEPRVD